MKKIELGQSISILANLGVIAGIVFLAVELQQNNEFLAAQSRATRVALRQADRSLVISNPELAHTLLKHRKEEPLTEYESLLLEEYMSFVLVNFQNVYREMREGFIVESTVPVTGWRTDFEPGGDLNMRDYWERRGGRGLDPDFYEWMEETVVNSR